MANGAAAKIEIGGAVPVSLIPELIDAILDAGPSAGWGDAAFQPRSAKALLAQAKSEDGFLRLFDDQALRYSVDLWDAYIQAIWNHLDDVLDAE
jgi:hypothetical protein